MFGTRKEGPVGGQRLSVWKTAVLALVLGVAGCGSDGSDGAPGVKGDIGPSRVLTGISSDGSDYVFSVITDDLIDLRFSTDRDCDWANVSTCENGFIIDSVTSENVRVPLDNPLKVATTWYVQAAHDTDQAQQAVFSTDVEPLLFFGNASVPGELIKVDLKRARADVLLTAAGSPDAVTADFSSGWVYFSYFDEEISAPVIDRVSIHSGEQERVGEFTFATVYLSVDNQNDRLLAATTSGLRIIDISDSVQFGNARTIDDVDSRYNGVAWNPETSEVLALSTDGMDCRLRAIRVEDGSFRELDRGDRPCSSSPLALDVEQQVVYYDIGSSTPFQQDLATGTISELPLPSYSRRGMTIDPSRRDLYYRGSLNTVRRQSLDNPDDDEEILPEAEPSFSQSAAVLLIPAR